MKHFICILILLIFNVFVLFAQKDFIVVIDAGHGGKDPGTTGTVSKEKAINLSVALKLGALIEQNHKDVKVIYTRKTDVFIPLDERANIANRNNADLFISIHVNSVKKNKTPRGTETYTLGLANSEENLKVAMDENSVILMEDDYPKKYKGFDPNSSESYIMLEMAQGKQMEYSVYFASEIQHFFKKNGRPNRGVRQAGFLVLRKTMMPGVLVELGFISNPEEERFLTSNSGQTVYAQSICNAFDKFKKNYGGRRNEILKDEPIVIDVTSNSMSPKKQDNSPAENQKRKISKSNLNDNTIYKIQILTSNKVLPKKDRRFKGYGEISYYVENGIYKYTYGEETEYKEILKKFRDISKDFKDSFIIRTKEGKRIRN